MKNRAPTAAADHVAHGHSAGCAAKTKQGQAVVEAERSQREDEPREAKPPARRQPTCGRQRCGQGWKTTTRPAKPR